MVATIEQQISADTLNMTNDEVIADIARLKCKHINDRTQRRAAERKIIKMLNKAVEAI